jgi:hypothetical protein
MDQVQIYKIHTRKKMEREIKELISGMEGYLSAFLGGIKR